MAKESSQYLKPQKNPRLISVSDRTESLAAAANNWQDVSGIKEADWELSLLSPTSHKRQFEASGLDAVCKSGMRF